MKKQVIILAIAALLTGFANTGKAQVKINEHGKLIVGRNLHLSVGNEDLHNVLSATIFGKNGMYNAGSKLSFGDFGRREFHGWNVFVGEYDSIETDQLWLHGKNGIYFSYSQGYPGSAGTIGYFDVNKDPYAVQFLHNVKASHFFVSVPSSTKHTTRLESPLAKIKSLNGIRFVSINESIPASQTTNANNSNLTPKEQQDVTFFTDLENKLRTKETPHIGLQVEQLTKIFPELIDTNKNGEIAVDYVSLIPVLVEAIKEQSQIILAQTLKINEIDGDILSIQNTPSTQPTTKSAGTTKSTKSAIIDTTQNNADSTQALNAFLYQNNPNPFNTQTTINYFLPEEVQTATIYIFSLQGSLLATYTLQPDFGFGSLTIDASSLNSGTYFYTLTVNNQEIDTKKMILTN
ncbi:MAG: T9SS type A sorting domain-containing protein [Bacteroidales bacterium]|jgi:hypothetical protein|nr:T9SS type A sorting domain-containing protein [Bacteroidales bacterium]